MSSRILRAAVACALAAVLIIPALPTMACGPDYPDYVFVATERPDLVSDYVSGKLDIVLRGYGPSYLVVAYRYLSGKPLSSDEQSQFVDLWNRYHSGGPQITTADSSGWEDALQQWAQRTHFQLPAAPQSSPTQSMAYLPQSYQSYDNCYTDAYLTAANTLRARAQEFGDDSPAVRSWVEAQIAVFRNCVTPGTATPDPASADMPVEIRKDRDYQIAAADFYGDDWDNAEKEFFAISADPSSPWRAIAALVAARCEIRKGTLGTDDPDQRQEDFSNADKQLKKIIADPAFASVRSAAEGLRGFVEIRSDPEGRAVELSNLLQQDSDAEHFAQNVDDYTKVMQSAVDSLFKDPALREKSDMTDWILSFRGVPNSAATEAHDIVRWQQTQSVAWLVAALENAQENSPQLTPLLLAAAKVPQDSPAYLTVAYEKDRILGVSGREAESRQNLDKLLATPQDGISASSRNVLLGLRMQLAANLDEFLRFAPRVPASPEGVGPMFDDDSAPAFAKTLPLSVVQGAVRSKALPDTLRNQVAAAGWTRAILLQDDHAALELAPTVAAVSSDLKDEFAPYMAAESSDDREFAAVFILLHTAGLTPYVDSADPTFDPHGNWWCSAKSLPNQAGMYQMYLPAPDAAPEQFLTATERGDADRQWAALSALPAGPDWLIQQTLAWAKKHPDDPRVPEALHFGVRATRYGCGDSSTGAVSKQAFDLLHRRYANSEWTKQTPYWFN